MSLLNPFRKLWANNSELKKHNEKLLQENTILLEEIKMLKKLLYDIELDISRRLKNK